MTEHAPHQVENSEISEQMLSLHQEDVNRLIESVSDAAEEVEMLQGRKEAIYESLQDALDSLDETGEVGDQETMRQMTYNSAKNKLMIYNADGNQERVRAGDLKVSATMWNESYYMGTEVPDETKRQYVIDQARYRIDELYDQQLAATEVARWKDLNEGRSDAYAMIRHHFERPETLEDGHIAEKMVESFLTKLAIDYDVPYEIKSVSVVDDVQYKIDFVLSPKQSEAQVGVAVEDAPEIGVQFTTARKESRIEHKKAQISQAKKDVVRETESSVKDIILVQLPLSDAREKYNTWQATPPKQRTPGGPDVLWDLKTKAQVYVGTVKQLIEQEHVSKAEAVAAWEQFQKTQ